MIHALVRKLSRWPPIVGLFVAYVACLIGFRIRQGIFGDIQTLDGDFGYGPGHARELFAEIEATEPALLLWYGWSEITLDIVFPIVYTLAAAVLIGWLYSGKGRLWVLIPFTAGAADVLENLTIAYLAFFHDADTPGFLWAAAASFSFAKWALLLVVLATIGLGAVLKLLRSFPGRS